MTSPDRSGYDRAIRDVKGWLGQWWSEGSWLIRRFEQRFGTKSSPDTPEGVAGRVRRIARDRGYAVGVHGSQERDLDLIAVPWTERAVPPHELVEALCEEGPFVIRDYPEDAAPGVPWAPNPEQRPHGRVVWTLHGSSDHDYIDLSVFSPVPPGAVEEKYRGLAGKLGGEDERLSRRDQLGIEDYEPQGVPHGADRALRDRVAEAIYRGRTETVFLPSMGPSRGDYEVADAVLSAIEWEDDGG